LKYCEVYKGSNLHIAYGIYNQTESAKIFEIYGGTKVTCVCVFLSRGRDILCRGHELLSRGHEIAKSWPRDTMSWPRVTKSWPRDSYVVATRFYVVVLTVTLIFDTMTSKLLDVIY
jgi:hypothetical protein